MTISFRPLVRADLEMLGGWLARPHVQRWWQHDPSPDAVERDFAVSIDGDDPTHLFVIVLDDRPIGMIQRYRIDDNPEWVDTLSVVDIPPAALGIDYLIGEVELTNRGIGSEAIAAFVARSWHEVPESSAIIVDVDPDNRPSWRVLERAGFVRIWTGNLAAPDPRDAGPAHIFRLDPPRLTPPHRC
ncbi:MAG: GNAT family N-acetyltransferase [Ilumatobacteraceae bacterium]